MIGRSQFGKHSLALSKEFMAPASAYESMLDDLSTYASSTCASCGLPWPRSAGFYTAGNSIISNILSRIADLQNGQTDPDSSLETAQRLPGNWFSLAICIF